MSKFNVTDKRHSATGQGPIAAKTGKPKTTHEGGVGYARTAASEVFLAATTSVDITADTFYSRGDARVERFVKLIRKVAVADPTWTAAFLRWLRSDGNIRTAAIVGAVEAVRAMVAAKIPGGRAIINSVCQRADEPGEIVAYYRQRYPGNLIYPIREGLKDAAVRLYSEYTLLKYDTASHGVRFGDVIELTHPKPDESWQHHLFKAAIDRRHGKREELGDHLPMLMANRQLRILAEQGSDLLLDPRQLRECGMTWEDVMSLAGGKMDKGKLWTALIPTMGYMALLRNLRNFDEAGVSDEVAATVAARLADPAQVARSRQLPMRFLSAYRNAPSLRWSYPLEQALDSAVGNIPALGGRTLVLVDTSQSMDDLFSKDHRDPGSPNAQLKRWDAAVMFGLALARRCAAVDVVSFSNDYYGTGVPSRVFPLAAGESLLRAIARWQADGYFLAAGTDTVGAIRRHYVGQDRVVVLTDEQHEVSGPAGGHVGRALPASTSLYVYNLAGYRKGSIVDSPNRVTLGGLTDAMFPLISRVEAGRDGAWPWETVISEIQDRVEQIPTIPGSLLAAAHDLADEQRG